MLLRKIFETQISGKHVLELIHWLLMTVDIYLTGSQVDAYFGEKKGTFYESFKEEQGLWKITLENIPTIKGIDDDAFYHIRRRFVGAIKARKYELKNFYEVFCLGFLLLDTEHRELDAKSNSLKEKEDFFKDGLKKFFRGVFPKEISLDAYLKGGDHSDIICFNTQDLKDYVLIECAANIGFGDIFSSSRPARSVMGHLNRLVDSYFRDRIEFFHHDSQRTQLSENPVNPSQSWFIYFHERLAKEGTFKDLENYIQNRKYQQIHIVLVDYDFDSNSFALYVKAGGSTEIKLNKLL